MTGLFRNSLFLILLFLGSCESNDEVEISVYNWTTVFDLSSSQELFLEEQDVNTIYTKFFDLVVNQEKEIVPVAKVLFDEIPVQNIVPVVYITTDVFSSLDSIGIEQLVVKTDRLIRELNPGKEFNEIQIDCDWMNSIKHKYFYFLDLLKEKRADCLLSCTVRLYQYKYPDLSGVPPVDKALLMYYNMGELTSYQEKNSILNNEIGLQYLGFGDYPLPLDFALPNFSWSLLYRYGTFQGILGSLTAEILNDTSTFELKPNGYYLVKKDTALQATYLRYGDEIRYENCSETELIKAANLLKSERNQTKTNLIFYDLKKTIHDETDKITSVFTAFE